jgi:hypothetical protein
VEKTFSNLEGKKDRIASYLERKLKNNLGSPTLTYVIRAFVMLQKYSHLSPARAANVVERLAALVAKSVTYSTATTSAPA